MVAFGPRYVISAASVSVASVTTTAITSTPGDLLVATITCFANHIGATPITDSKGNTWIQALASVGTTNGFTAMYYAQNSLGGASHTFTFTPTASDFLTITVIAVQGAAASSVLGSTTSAMVTGTVHASSTITSNASVPEIFIGGGSASDTVLPVLTPTTPTRWWQAFAQSGASTEGGIVGFRIVDPSVTDSFSFTTGTSRNEGVVLAGFKAAASSGASAGSASTFFGA